MIEVRHEERRATVSLRPLPPEFPVPEPNNPPVAAFSHVTDGLTAIFTDESFDSDGAVVAWHWDFGNGYTSTVQHARYTYQEAGTYEVTLTVWDDDGASDSVSRQIEVAAVAGVNEWGFIVDSHGEDTQPSDNANGTEVIPGNNAYGSWYMLLDRDQLPAPCYEIWVQITGHSLAGEGRNLLVTIGKDPNGGVSPSPYIEHLSGANAANTIRETMSGHWYRFPLFFEAGSTIWARASSALASVPPVRVRVILFGDPSRPELVRAGTFCRSFGANPSASNGTLVENGNTSQAAWTELGTLADELWAWEWGFGRNGGSTPAAYLHGDIAVGSDTQKRYAVYHGPAQTTTAEQAGKGPHGNLIVQAGVGEKVYGRLRTTAPDAQANYWMIAYGVGGAA